MSFWRHTCRSIIPKAFGTVEPRESADLHRKVHKGLNLHSTLCIKTERTLNNDFTVAYDSKFYQIEDKIKTATVIVEERLDGAMAITHNGLVLTYKELPERPKKQRKLRIPKKRVCHKPPVNHPWKKIINNSQRNRRIWAVAMKS